MRPPQFAVPVTGGLALLVAICFWMGLELVRGLLLSPVWALHRADRLWQRLRR